jgi:hypothetical protein
VHPSATAKYEDSDLAKYMVASHRTLEGVSGVFGIAEDGVRVGDPAEETLFAVLWSAGVDRAVVLPPQVSSRCRRDYFKFFKGAEETVF